MNGTRSLLALVAGALLAAAADGAPAPQSSNRKPPGTPIVSGLGARGPQRFDATAAPVDSVMARDAALALYDASRGEDDGAAAGAPRRRGRTAIDFARFHGPSIGYATIMALTLGAALMRVRRGKSGGDASSRLDEPAIGLPARAAPLAARASARPAAKPPRRG